MRDVIGFGTVLVAILAGILLNRSDVKELRGEIKELSGKDRLAPNGDARRIQVFLHDAR
jgi:hypothetical protein